MKQAAVDLRLGRWQDVLADVRADSLICDPPYTARTHKGQRSGEADSESLAKESKIDYPPIDVSQIGEFVDFWTDGRIARWFVIFSDHIGNRLWLEALAAAGLYTFAPVVWVKNDGGPRFCGDGPASTVEHIAIARTRNALSKQEKRSRRGWYKGPISRERIVVGGKPEWLMQALVRDYSEPWQTVVDPFAGGGTTLLAARACDRQSIGAEVTPEIYKRARRRLIRGFQPALFFRGQR